MVPVECQPRGRVGCGLLRGNFVADKRIVVDAANEKHRRGEMGSPVIFGELLGVGKERRGRKGEGHMAGDGTYLIKFLKLGYLGKSCTGRFGLVDDSMKGGNAQLTVVGTMSNG